MPNIYFYYAVILLFQILANQMSFWQQLGSPCSVEMFSGQNKLCELWPVLGCRALSLHLRWAVQTLLQLLQTPSKFGLWGHGVTWGWGSEVGEKDGEVKQSQQDRRFSARLRNVNIIIWVIWHYYIFSDYWNNDSL